MNEINNRNYLAWEADMRRRAEVARGLRFALFALSTAAVAAVVWLGLCYAAPVVLRYEARVQAEMDAEFEGLQDAYDAELLREIERGAGR